MTNMKVLHNTKRAPALGDIFCFQVLDEKYHWGRVVSLSANVGGFENCILIYLYDIQSPCSTIVPELDVENLLLAPIATNQLPWKKGYFKTIDNRKLVSDDLLGKHCFKSVLRGTYFDDNGEQLDRAYEPCGINGLDSYRTIDDKVSEALGIELVPD